jgi:hypothetical protein
MRLLSKRSRYLLIVTSVNIQGRRLVTIVSSPTSVDPTGTQSSSNYRTSVLLVLLAALG